MNAAFYELVRKAKTNGAINHAIQHRSAEKLTADIMKFAHNSQAQLAVVMGMQDAASAQKGTDPGSLAHSIVMGQQEKILQFGAKAYPLSERQVASIVRDLIK